MGKHTEPNKIMINKKSMKDLLHLVLAENHNADMTGLERFT